MESRTWGAGSTSWSSTLTVVAMIVGVCTGQAFAQSSGRVIQVEKVLLTPLKSVQVPARAAGVIDTLEIGEGDVIARGDILIGLDDREEQLQYDQARASREFAVNAAENDLAIESRKKELQLAESDLSRARASQERFKDSVSDAEIERKQLAVDQAQLNVMQAQMDQKQLRIEQHMKEIDVDSAAHRLELKRIIAPISGVVSRIDYELGEWVNVGDSVVSIVTVDSLKIEGFLNASQAAVVEPDDRVTLLVNVSPDERLEVAGRMAFVDPSVDPSDGTVRFWAVADNRQRKLRPGTTGSLVIHP